jgi:uncharacterized membrane protein (UPF0127 family)
LISDPAGKEDLQINGLGKRNKACCFEFQERAESYYEHERYEHPLDMIFINMSKEVVAVRSLSQVTLKLQ